MSGFWTPRSIAAVVGGRWVGEPCAGACAGVSIDSRAIEPGQIFIAIKGDRFDGHDFIDAAMQRGAAFAIVDRDVPGLKVDDTLVALQQLATAYRDVLAQQGCRVIAVAGSNGKTTTRHLIHHVLTHAGLRGTQSPKSFNNHIGVPLTLLGASESDEFVVVEVGTNHPGEIAALGRIVRPDIAVVTSIGAEHLEFFGDLNGVAKEEVSLLAFVREGGVALIPRHYDWPEDLEFPLPVGAQLGEFLWQDPAAAAVALPGAHNLSNAAAAAAVARCFDLEDAAISAALATVAAVEGRSQVMQLPQRVTLINDSYNANPSSMYAALDVLGELSGDRRKVAVLGDMLELGDETDRAHAQIVREALLGGVDLIVLIGPRFTAYTHDQAANTADDTMPANIRLFPELDDTAVAEIASLLQPGDVVLLKASRGMRLERLIPAMQQRFAPMEVQSPGHG